MIKTSRFLELEASETGTKREKNLQILLKKDMLFKAKLKL